MPFEIKDGVLRRYREEPGVTEAVIPDGVTCIRNGAFHSCENLTSITIPESVVKIGCGAFTFCRSLISITIPGGVTSIVMKAFQNCSSLTSIVIPDIRDCTGNKQCRVDRSPAGLPAILPKICGIFRQ